MGSDSKKRQNGSIDWNKIKVTFIPASSVDVNPLNPASELSAEEREKMIIAIAARILNNETEA